MKENIYLKLKNKQQKEIDTFPLALLLVMNNLKK